MQLTQDDGGPLIEWQPIECAPQSLSTLLLVEGAVGRGRSDGGSELAAFRDDGV